MFKKSSKLKKGYIFCSISIILFCVMFASAIASEYRFSLVDERHVLRTEQNTEKPLEKNYTRHVLQRLCKHFEQFENSTDWKSKTDKKFSSSVWGFISNEIVAAVTKESRHGITTYGKDPNKIMAYGEGYLPVDSYSGANWNALLLMNVINQVLYGKNTEDNSQNGNIFPKKIRIMEEEIPDQNVNSDVWGERINTNIVTSVADNDYTHKVNSAIDAAVRLLQEEYGESYQEEVSAAESDIRIYMNQLKLHECLAEERKHITNVDLGTARQNGYLEYELSSGELKNITISTVPDDHILHITLPSELKMANKFRIQEKDLPENSSYTIDFNDIDTSEVIDMSEMFHNCKGLTSLDISNFDTSKVKNMEKMFCNCHEIISLELRNSFRTGNVTNMLGMFQNCKSLLMLDVKGLDTSEVTTMSGMFFGCSSLKNLDLTGFNVRNVEKMLYMFSDCSSLISLDISSFNHPENLIHDFASAFYAFNKCANLKKLIIGGDECAIVHGYYLAAWVLDVKACMDNPPNKMDTIRVVDIPDESARNISKFIDICSKYGYYISKRIVSHDGKSTLILQKSNAKKNHQKQITS